MKALKLILMTLALVTGVGAQAADCEFVSRDSLGPVLAEMPAQVIGWLNCSGRAKGVNVFLVARLTNLDENSLVKFALSNAKKIDFTAQSVAVTWQSKQPLANRQLMVRSESISGSEKLAMSHYTFVHQGHVFIHSMDEAETLKVKPQLNDVNLAIRRLKPANFK